MQRSLSRSARLIAAAFIVFALAAALAPVGAGAKPKNDCRRFVPGANLSKCDLRNLDLSGLDLRGADLSKARLDGADLSDTLLVEADLTKVSAVGVSFFHANLREAIVIKGDFTASTFENAVLIDAIGIDSADFDFVICVDGSPAQNGVCPAQVSVLDVRIIDTSGNALPNILVELYEEGDTDGDGAPGELIGSECTSTLTPADLYAGEADFSGVVDGNYTVLATDSGASCAAAGLYEDTTASFTYNLFNDSADAAVDDDVKGNGVMVGFPDATLALAPVATEGVLDVFVHGTDVDEPLTGILVTLESADGTMFQWDCTVDGEVDFIVPEGAYEIIATDTEFSGQYACGNGGDYETETVTFDYTIAGDLVGDGDIDDDIASVGANADVNMPLDPLAPLGMLNVFVQDPLADVPLSGIWVELYDASGQQLLDRECSTDGEAFFGVGNGDYILRTTISDGSDGCIAPVQQYEPEVDPITYSIATDAQDGFVFDDLSTGNGSPDHILNLQPLP